MGRVNKPHFICPGFQKCGTTAFAINLSRHSQLSVSHDQPGWEINYFQKKHSNSKKPIDWYLNLFKGDDGIKRGDVSPNYSFCSEYSAKEISKNFPNVKIIFLLRNPIDRAHSAYCHYMRDSKFKNLGTWDHTKNFIENVKLGKFYVNYIDHINNYMDYFDNNQTIFLINERFQADCKSEYSSKFEYSRLFKFLNVKQEYIKNKKYNGRLPKQKYTLTSEEREVCRELYQRGVSQLFDFLGYEIKSWTDFC